MQFIKDILVSFVVAMLSVIAAFCMALLICVPLVAGVFALSWALATTTGLSVETARLIVMGTLAVVCLTWGAYLEKKSTDRWIQSILDAADQRAEAYAAEMREEHRTEKDGPCEPQMNP